MEIKLNNIKLWLVLKEREEYMYYAQGVRENGLPN